MKNKILSLVAAACCLASGASGQGTIIGPSNPPCGVPTTYMTTQSAFTYMWDFSNSGSFFTVIPYAVPPAPSPLPTLGPGTFSVPAFTCYVQDYGNSADPTITQHLFVNEYVSGNLYRIDYPASGFPGSPSAPVNLGNFGMTGAEAEGLDFVQQGGDWYGLMVNNGQLVQMHFGAITAVPTTIVSTQPSLLWPHQLTLKYYPDVTGDYHAFVANRNGSLIRYDFPGTGVASLMNPPTVVTIPNVGGVLNPCNFTLYQEPNGTGNWYALVTSLINATVSRYDFGPSLMAPAPTGTLLTTSTLFNLSRGIHIFPDCQGNLVAYEFNETGQINVLDFGGTITNNTPTVTQVAQATIGTTGTPTTCVYNNQFTFIESDFGNGGVYYLNPSFYNYLPVSNWFGNYFKNSQNFTFTPGLWDISLMYDMGRPSGPSVAPCREVNVKCPPCYDQRQTFMTVTQSTVDPCTFTACVNINTTNTITGYTWDVEPGGTIFTDATSSSTDCFTFSIAPGTVYTITVTAHIVDAELNCCQAVLSQQIQCGNANGPGNKPAHAGPGEHADVNGSDLQIFPNPTNNTVSVASETTGISLIQVFTISGQKLKDYSFDGTAKETSISLEKLPAGSYIIRVNDATSRIINKVD
jgi:hypothetical protein